jgi:hypothetical protein
MPLQTIGSPTRCGRRHDRLHARDRRAANSITARFERKIET